MFDFFLTSYRKGVLTFSGIKVDIQSDVNQLPGKEVFRMYDDGFYKNGKQIISRHPNIVSGVIIGKKAWGLWVDQWSEGITECTFTLDEILNEFKKRNIEIPEPLFKDFLNRIEKKKGTRNKIELERLRSLTY